MKKITKLPSQHSLVGHHRHANETPFKWRYAGGPVMVCLQSRLNPPLINLKNVVKVGPLWQKFWIRAWFPRTVSRAWLSGEFKHKNKFLLYLKTQTQNKHPNYKSMSLAKCSLQVGMCTNPRLRSAYASGTLEGTFPFLYFIEREWEI